ncbi:hypothetical protein Ddc_03863 [Ditylenchus destructor]|nr:hypothetical protein Ddc_03863 [Ditylenchus destructor]
MIKIETSTPTKSDTSATKIAGYTALKGGQRDENNKADKKAQSESYRLGQQPTTEECEGGTPKVQGKRFLINGAFREKL